MNKKNKKWYNISMLVTTVCSKCHQEKPIEDFYTDKKNKTGRSYWCKECHKERHREYYVKNKYTINDKNRKYRLAHLDEARAQARAHYHTTEQAEYRRRYAENNRERKKAYMKAYREKNKKHIREKQREYYHKNKDLVSKINKRSKDRHRNKINAQAKIYRQNNRKLLNDKQLARLHNDQVFHLKSQVRGLIRDSFKRKHHHKSSYTADIVGCDLDYLCNYLFKTWENNYGQPWNGEPYHIDHIIPLATAETEEEVIKLCHYTNLQLLTPEDNMDKSDKT